MAKFVSNCGLVLAVARTVASTVAPGVSHAAFASSAVMPAHPLGLRASMRGYPRIPSCRAARSLSVKMGGYDASTSSGPPSNPGKLASFVEAAGKAERKWGQVVQGMPLPKKGEHTATVVWAHGLGDTGFGWAPVAVSFGMPWVKFIFPTAPVCLPPPPLPSPYLPNTGHDKKWA